MTSSINKVPWFSAARLHHDIDEETFQMSSL
jgi:hypothetical protein